MTLPPRTARLVELFVCVVLDDRDGLARVRAAAPAGEPDRAWREAFLQAHLFAGFPRTVEAGEVLLRGGGLGAPDPDELDEAAPGAGAALFDAIYADAAQRVRERLAAAHPLHARLVAEHAYGRILARPGLDAATRELLAVAALAVTGQERQLASHARGALRCGATAGALAGTLRQVARRLDPEPLERARDIVARFGK
jgi:4-carboxymuconolactone decarboxylase